MNSYQGRWVPMELAACSCRGMVSACWVCVQGQASEHLDRTLAAP